MGLKEMQDFRKRYRADIAPNYRGWQHMLTVLFVGIAVISYAILNVKSSTPLEWILFPITLLIVNFAEYYAHRWLGHKKTRLGKLFYQRHTGDHHSFFLEQAMAFESVRDWRVVLFPSYLIFAFLIGLVIPLGTAIFFILSANCSYIFASAAISGYLFYEIMHFSYHIPKNTSAEKIFLSIPYWSRMREAHEIHHKREVMTEKNFNITLPIFDRLLGTWQTSKKGSSL